MSISKTVEFANNAANELAIAWPRKKLDWKSIPLGWISYEEPQLLNTESKKFDLPSTAPISELVNAYLASSDAPPLEATAKEIVAAALRSVSLDYPPIASVLFNFRIVASSRVPTMGVRFDAKIGKVEMLYNPRFTVMFALIGAISKRIADGNNTQIGYDEVVNTISFVLIHEAMHVIKAHTSSQEGVRKITPLSNIVYDSQINTQLKNLLRDKVPPSLIDTDGVGEGTFFSVSTSWDRIDTYLGRPAEETHEVSRYLALKIKEMRSWGSYTGIQNLHDAKFFFFNIKHFFSTFSPNQVVDGFAIFESEVCTSPLTQKPNLLPDVVKEALRNLNKAQDQVYPDYAVGDLVQEIKSSEVFKIIGVARGAEETRLDPAIKNDGGYYEIEHMRHSTTYFRIGRSIRPYEDVQYRTGMIVSTRGSKGWVMERTGTAPGVGTAAPGDGTVYKKYLLGTTRGPFPTTIETEAYLIDEVLESQQTAFVGDVVLVPGQGRKGTITKADWESHYYEISYSVSTAVAEFAELARWDFVVDIPYEKAQYDIREGDAVAISGTSKVGMVIETPQTEAGKFKVKIIPTSVWETIVSNMKTQKNLRRLEAIEVVAEIQKKVQS